MSKRDQLKARAAELGVPFKGNISNSDLEALIKEAAENTPPTTHGTGGMQSDTSPEPVSGVVVVVTGPRNGRRRAGYDFGKQAVEIPIDDLTPDQRDALSRDPKLTLQLFKDGAPVTDVIQGGTDPEALHQAV